MPPKGRKQTSAVIKDDKIEKADSDSEECKDPGTKPSPNDKALSKEDEALRDDSATAEDSSKDRRRDTKKKSYAEVSDEEEDTVPKKRVSRAVKPKAKLVDDSEEEEEEDDESEDEYVPPSTSPRGKGKAPPRKRKGDESDDSGSYGKKTKRSRKPARKPKKKNESDFSEEEDSDDDWGSKKSGGRSKGASRSRKTPVATPTRRGERNRGKQKVTSYAEDDDEESDGPSAKVEPKSRAVEKKVKSPPVEEEIKSEVEDKDESEEELAEPASKQANGKKNSEKVKAVDSENGLKEEVEEVEDDEDMEESKQPSAKRKAEKKEKAPSKKPAEGLDFASLDFSCGKETSDGKPWNLKISSWNVAGLRAIAKKNGLDYLTYEKPDIFCLQEIKCPEKKLPPETKVEGYHTYWSSGEKDGYGGTGLYTKEKPIDVKYGIGNPEFDEHGRLITAEYEKFYLVNAYVINSGRGLVNLEKRKEWDKEFREYLKNLDEKKPVILTGDLNVAHQPIDLTNPKTNTKNAGFTQEERDGFTKLLEEGFVDSFRHLYPDKKDSYTFWTNMNNARERNVGWRLDYFVISKKLIPNLCESTMRSQVYGSDHCPITLFINV